MVALTLGELTDFHSKGERLREVRKAKHALEARNPIRRNEHPFRNLVSELRGFRLINLRASRRQATHFSWVKLVMPLLFFETCCSSVKLVAF